MFERMKSPLFLPTYDYRNGSVRRSFVQAPNFSARGRFKSSVIEPALVCDRRRPVKKPAETRIQKWVEVCAQPWSPNLILDSGLDKLATVVWADTFLYAVAGTGNTPVSDDSSTTTVSQSGTALTLSGTLAAVSAGKLIRWDTGEEAMVVSGSGTAWVADRSQSVSAGQFTVYRVDQTGLDTELSGTAGRSNNYLAGSPDCDTTRSGAVYTMTRTYDFGSPSISSNYAEVGVSNSNVQANNLFSRMLITGGSVTVLTTQQLRLSYQLRLTVGPITPVSKTASITGWPISPATTTDGTEQMAFIGLSKVNTAGTSGSWDGFNNINRTSEPSVTGQIFLSTNASAHLTYPDGPDRLSAATKVNTTLASYTAGSFLIDKSGVYAPSEAVGTSWRSMGLIGSSGASQQDLTFAFLFDQAQSKDNTHTLTLTFRFNWARDLS